MGAGSVSSVLTRVLALIGHVVVWAAQQFLPAWLVGSTTPQSHGSSRWARSADLARLGRARKADRLAGDGIVLGFLHGNALQSPAEDNVLLLGVQRSGKTSCIVVPTLLAWSGAAIATSTKEELVNLTLDRRLRVGPTWVFAPLDEDQSWLDRLGLQSSTWNPLEAASTSGAAAGSLTTSPPRASAATTRTGTSQRRA
jgi:type IV secretory pathway TraG/TraD family ATPase VirD4